jgi:hypothetical protein
MGARFVEDPLCIKGPATLEHETAERDHRLRRRHQRATSHERASDISQQTVGRRVTTGLHERRGPRRAGQMPNHFGRQCRDDPSPVSDAVLRPCLADAIDRCQLTIGVAPRHQQVRPRGATRCIDQGRAAGLDRYLGAHNQQQRAVFEIVTDEIAQANVHICGDRHEATIARRRCGAFDESWTIGERAVEHQPTRLALATVVEHLGQHRRCRLCERRVGTSWRGELADANRGAGSEVPRMRVGVRVVAVVKQSSHACVYASRRCSSNPE